MENLGKLYELYAKYNSICNFVVIYVQEAHPTDEWSMKINEKKNINLLQHRQIEDKIASCKELINIWKDESKGFDQAIDSGKFKIVCDDIDCNVEIKFNAFPERIFLLDQYHKIAVKGGYGPFDFDPTMIDQFLCNK